MSRSFVVFTLVALLFGAVSVNGQLKEYVPDKDGNPVLADQATAPPATAPAVTPAPPAAAAPTPPVVVPIAKTPPSPPPSGKWGWREYVVIAFAVIVVLFFVYLFRRRRRSTAAHVIAVAIVGLFLIHTAANAQPGVLMPGAFAPGSNTQATLTGNGVLDFTRFNITGCRIIYPGVGCTLDHIVNAHQLVVRVTVDPSAPVLRTGTLRLLRDDGGYKDFPKVFAVAKVDDIAVAQLGPYVNPVQPDQHTRASVAALSKRVAALERRPVVSSVPTPTTVSAPAPQPAQAASPAITQAIVDRLVAVEKQQSELGERLKKNESATRSIGEFSNAVGRLSSETATAVIPKVSHHGGQDSPACKIYNALLDLGSTPKGHPPKGCNK